MNFYFQTYKKKLSFDALEKLIQNGTKNLRVHIKNNPCIFTMLLNYRHIWRSQFKFSLATLENRENRMNSFVEKWMVQNNIEVSIAKFKR